MIRCSNCMRVFAGDDDLTRIEEGDEWFLGCPDCKTDDYLMEMIPGNIYLGRPETIGKIQHDVAWGWVGIIAFCVIAWAGIVFGILKLIGG